MEEGGMKTCPVCGKSHIVMYPHLFPYRRGAKYYCCYDCMMIDESKDMNLIHQVRRERRMRKLARMKKDGTPAKRPGPKPRKADVPAPIAGGDWEKIPRPAAELKLDGAVRIETPEAKNVQVVEVPEKMRPVPPPIEYKVTAISTDIGEFQFIKRADYIDWTTPTGETVSMSLEEWKELMRIWPFVLKVLGVEL